MTTTTRRGFVGLLAAGVMLGSVGSGAASAAEQWCETDPLVLIATPGGNLVPLFVTTGAEGLLHLAQAQLARIEYTVSPSESGRATRVSMTVTVPVGLDAARFSTRSVVSTGPLKTGVILASVSGTSGHAMRMEFKLDAP